MNDEPVKFIHSKFIHSKLVTVRNVCFAPFFGMFLL